MEPQNTNITDLIARYFNGETSSEEIVVIEQWVKADPANADTFREYQRTWKVLEDTRVASETDLDTEWNTLKTKIGEASTQPPVHRMTTATDAADIPKRVYFTPARMVRIAALLLVLLIPVFLLTRYLAAPGEKSFSCISGPSAVTLPDGSVVTLNDGAEISYPERFIGDTRDVTLAGEAFFEVAHDAVHPFVVTSGNFRVRVVGTTFLVNTHATGNKRQVILETGKVTVSIEGKPGLETTLNPGELAETAGDGEKIITGVNADPNYLAWKTRRMVFNDTPLNEVAACIAKVYRTRLVLSGNGLSECRITATFDQQTLEQVLNVLKTTLDLDIRKTGAAIELSGSGCGRGH